MIDTTCSLKLFHVNEILTVNEYFLVSCLDL